MKFKIKFRRHGKEKYWETRELDDWYDVKNLLEQLFEKTKENHLEIIFEKIKSVKKK